MAFICHYSCKNRHNYFKKMGNKIEKNYILSSISVSLFPEVDLNCVIPYFFLWRTINSMLSSDSESLSRESTIPVTVLEIIFCTKGFKGIL